MKPISFYISLSSVLSSNPTMRQGALNKVVFKNSLKTFQPQQRLYPSSRPYTFPLSSKDLLSATKSIGRGSSLASALGAGRGYLTEVGTVEQYRDAIANAPKDRLIVVQFSAPWCGPCRQIKPIVAKWSQDISNVDFIIVDIDELSALVDEEAIQNVPTFVLMKNGKTVERIIGANADKLKTAILNHSETSS